VRIEDDILVTENGYINMSEAAPREIDAIEKLMKQKGVGNY
jgi:Xaa-Pro aminopeptidase